MADTTTVMALPFPEGADANILDAVTGIVAPATVEE